MVAKSPANDVQRFPQPNGVKSATPVSKTLSKAQRDALKIRVIALAQAIGPRPAARECGLNEDTVCVWLHRFQRKHGDIMHFDTKANRSPAISSNGLDPTKALEAVIARHSDRSRLGLAYAGTKSAEKFAELPAEQLVQRDTAIAFEATSRAIDRTHGWSIAAQQAPTVNVAVQVNAPTAEERAELTALDRKLDAIAAKLKASEQA